jgi:branched-chain amino acid transport system ATP-binding protein
MTAPENHDILIVDNVTRTFGGLRAVNGCSLTVKRGSITGLIGPNGAGKTTLFNIITGFLKPTSGRIYFQRDGNGAPERIDGLPPHRVFKKGIVRTFQIPRELKNMTLLENLMLVPPGQTGESIWNPLFLPFRVSRQEEEIFNKAVEVLTFVDLIHLRDEYASTLSGGQKKLLELARTLMCNPTMILLDEPGAGVNRVLMKKLVADIERLRRDLGLTFFVVEHDMDLITQLCDTVIVMSEGAKLAEGTPEAVKKDERVLEAYLGGQYR